MLTFTDDFVHDLVGFLFVNIRYGSCNYCTSPRITVATASITREMGEGLMLSVWSKVGARAVLRLPAQASLHAGQATDLAAPEMHARVRCC